MKRTKKRDTSEFNAEELREATTPIASLISKSEKAQEKLKAGTWQFSTLEGSLKALRIAYALMTETENLNRFTQEELLEAVQILTAMLIKVSKIQEKFQPGTSQHSLLRNRQNALGIAESLMKSELKRV